MEQRHLIAWATLVLLGLAVLASAAPTTVVLAVEGMT